MVNAPIGGRRIEIDLPRVPLGARGYPANLFSPILPCKFFAWEGEAGEAPAEPLRRQARQEPRPPVSAVKLGWIQIYRLPYVSFALCFIAIRILPWAHSLLWTVFEKSFSPCAA